MYMSFTWSHFRASKKSKFDWGSTLSSGQLREDGNIIQNKSCVNFSLQYWVKTRNVGLLIYFVRIPLIPPLDGGKSITRAIEMGGP
jgi:hypothetical protein